MGLSEKNGYPHGLPMATPTSNGLLITNGFSFIFPHFQTRLRGSVPGGGMPERTKHVPCCVWRGGMSGIFIVDITANSWIIIFG